MVDHELNELRREFLDEARGKIDEMELALDSADGGRDRLAYLAHQLKGSGGSYGYQRISEDAAELEKAIEGGRANGDLATYVSNLRGAIERAANELA